jgi:hypothetical protein
VSVRDLSTTTSSAFIIADESRKSASAGDNVFLFVVETRTARVANNNILTKTSRVANNNRQKRRALPTTTF